MLIHITERPTYGYADWRAIYGSPGERPFNPGPWWFSVMCGLEGPTSRVPLKEPYPR